jgi:uncharacterized protein (DUF362 family)
MPTEQPKEKMDIEPLREPRVGVFRGNADYRDAETAIRGALAAAGLDGNRPLEGLVRPGDCVVLKPNLIREGHATRPDEWEQVITHGAVIRVMAGLAAEALRGDGRIVIADGPQTDSDFDEICARTGLPEIAEQLRRSGIRCDLLDLRRDRWFQKGDVIYKRVRLPGDPAGYTTVDLGAASEFATYKLSGRFYGADYDVEETARYHNRERHAYVLCRTILDADVVINLPKLKTHKKTGVTISLKNLVGINGYRNCLPHFTTGTIDEGGDEFPSSDLRSKVQSRAILRFKKALMASGRQGGPIARLIKRTGKAVFGDTNEVVRSGNWHGNDTIWRMVLDLNKVLFNFNGIGVRRSAPLRYLSVVDGIIAGEGNGPMSPDAVAAGLVVAGLNPVAVDSACALLMGFDDRKIPLLAGGWKATHFPLADFRRQTVRCVSNIEEWNGNLEDMSEASDLNMKPHFGWQGRIERSAEAAAAGVREQTRQP